MLTNTEIHVVHNPSDAELAALAGLTHILDEETCAGCGASVGCVDTAFKPVAIVLNEDHEWFLCLSCAGPAVKPRN